MNSVLPNKVGDTSDDSSTKLKARAMHSATPTLSLSTISRSDSADSYSCDSSKGSSRVSSRGSAVSVLPTTSPVVGSGSGSGAVSSSASVSSPPFRSIQPFASPLTATLSPITHNVKGGLYRAIHSRDSSVDEDPLNTRVPHTPTSQTYSMSNLCPSPPVTETTEIQLEYDPISRRKVLNTYEILREIGRGEHGKVKLAKDLVHNELVAIKIVSRWRRNKPSLRRKSADPANEYEVKIRREIAIMKTCNHKHIVRLREVLDDVNSNKIYLVLEYLEKGEIRWKRTANTKSQANANQSDDIPCCGAKSRKSTTFGPAINTTMDVTPSDDTNQDNYLLSNEYSPNLTFKQSRKIFRDVILGLEYLHMQGIVHRDIKPANLLVSAQNVVKISDFGVSFASSLNGLVADELELAKTAGTPAFFAPELCGGAGCRKEDKFEDTDPHENSDNYSNRIKTCESADCTMKINYKIDIWALGVTLYCLLFGKVPFNADSEFELFQVIANDPFEFPSSPHDFNSPGDVTNTEFEFAKDLLRKLLDKNATTRIEISEIKKHPFTLMDMEADELYSFNNMNNGDVVLTETEISNSGSLVGVGARIKRSLVKAIRGSISSGSESEARNRFAALSLDHSRSTSSEESSYNSTIRLNSNGGNNSMILSEAFGDYSGIGSRAISRSGSTSDATAQNATSPRASRSSSYSLPQNFIDSANTSRRGSSASAVEAPQIETKRNVGGDLYLKNQTAVEAFKGIQEMDEKRRHAKEREEKRRNSREKEQKLAQSKTLEQSFKTSPYNPSDLRYSFDSKDPADPKHSPKPLTLKVGPISIEPRRPSCVMALPLSESFASLDSLNDDYLTLKYHEFTTNKAASAAATMAATPVTPNLSISDKFNSFNMDSSMKKTSVTPKAREGIPPFQRFSSDSSSYSDESSSSDDEEAGNLTLAFTSKVGAASRPKVLSLSNRSKSHDSNLPRLINHASEVRQFDVPIMFQEDLPEFEDLPFGLIPDLTRGGSTATGMGPSVSLMSNASNATLTPEKMGPSISQMTVRMGDYGSTPPESSSGSFSTPGRSPQVQRTISPLVMNAPTSDIATANSHLRNQVIRSVAGDSITERSDHFNNHYKKEPVYSPFPNALHLDNDKDAKRDSACEKQVKNRPNYYRSNSVTVGILQNNR